MKTRRVFSVEDDNYSTAEAKAERTAKVRQLQARRAVRNNELLRSWKRKLKRARTEVVKRQRRAAYYAKVLA